MNERLGYRAAMLLSCIALALLVVNTALALANSGSLQEVEDRRAAIGRGAALHQLTLQIANDLNAIGNQNGDRQLCAMLRAEAMTVTGKCGMLDGLRPGVSVP